MNEELKKEAMECQDFDNGQPNEEINNRSQDGRVCDCEDAPCCGHYEL